MWLWTQLRLRIISGDAKRDRSMDDGNYLDYIYLFKQFQLMNWFSSLVHSGVLHSARFHSPLSVGFSLFKADEKVLQSV